MLLVNQTTDTATSAIYALVHRDSGRLYVGLTKGTVANRWRQHRYDALEKKTRNYLACAIRKYGAEAFEVLVLEHGIAAAELQAREALYVAALSANVGGIGFNSTAGGEVAPSSDPRVRAKISAAQTGRLLTPEWRAKVSAALKRRPKNPAAMAIMHAAQRAAPRTAEWRAALSESHKGKRPTEETRAKMSFSQRQRSPETRKGHGDKMRVRWADPDYKARVSAKISAANSTEAYRAKCAARVYSEETRRKLSAAAKRRKGYKHSAETKARMSAAERTACSDEKRQKLSAALKKYWADRRKGRVNG